MLSGGKFLASGEDTCVFANPPVQCVPGTLKTRKSGNYDPKNMSYISRIIPKNDPDNKELEAQRAVNRAIKRIDVKYPTLRVGEHYSLAVAYCTPLVTKPDFVNGPCGKEKKASTTTKKTGKAMSTVGPQYKYVNLITERHDKDLDKKLEKAPTEKEFVKAFFDLMNAQVALSSEGIINFDLHAGNLSWSTENWPNKKLIMPDWGRTIFSYTDFLNRIQHYFAYKSAREQTKLKKENSEYDQLNAQFVVFTRIVGKGYNTSSLFKEESKKILDDEKYLSQLQKLFIAWDTYSLFSQLANPYVQYKGYGVFKIQSIKNVLQNKKFYLSPKQAIALLDNLVMNVKLTRPLYLQSIWEIIRYVFREKNKNNFLPLQSSITSSTRSSPRSSRSSIKSKFNTRSHSKSIRRKMVLKSSPLRRRSLSLMKL
jgi:hypothetical protein